LTLRTGSVPASPELQSARFHRLRSGKVAVMAEQNAMDVVAASIVARISPDVRASLNEVQLHAIGEAIKARSGLHILDVRRLLPLYFASYYVVLQFGRDRRMGRRRVEYDRRLRASIMAASPLILIALVGLYFLKASLGIDLFSFHLPNLLGFGH
jgi:hypothetical protein